MNQFISYPKCSTCQKAKKWLDANGIEYTFRNIKEDPLNVAELSAIIKSSSLPVKKFFNTSGILYREMNLKDKLPNMNEHEQIAILATNGMLVKRPLFIHPERVLIGFKEDAYKTLL